MAKTRKDAYEIWVETGKWAEVKRFITEAFRNKISQDEVCRRLDLHPTTFIRIKDKHKEIEEAILDGKLDLRIRCINNLLKSADGYEETITEVYFTEGKNGGEPQRKVKKITRFVPPDSDANIYLLSKLDDSSFNKKLLKRRI